MRILVVEDARDMNLLIVKTLKKAGYSVDGCFEGVEALEHLPGAEYDAMILDVMMLRLDGYELLSQPLLPGEPLTMAMEGSALVDPHVSEEHPLNSCELAADYLFIEDPEGEIRELRRAQKGKPLKILIPASDQ